MSVLFDALAEAQARKEAERREHQSRLTCRFCGKRFKTEGSLHQHQTDKHPAAARAAS